ncbi:predicted protein, partial [Nematostella vectensis]
ELGELIEDLTTTGKPTLDENHMKKLKSICKKSELYVEHAYHNLLTQLKKDHAEIRLSCLQIIRELFGRSHRFRELLLEEFQVFLELVVGTNCDEPLPPPDCSAKVLKETAINLIECWQQKYGPHYKKLDLGYRYLKRIKHVSFDQIRERASAQLQIERERERRKQDLLMKKLGNTMIEIADHTEDMELCVTEVNSCFKLLLPQTASGNPNVTEIGVSSLATENPHPTNNHNNQEGHGKKGGDGCLDDKSNKQTEGQGKRDIDVLPGYCDDGNDDDDDDYAAADDNEIGFDDYDNNDVIHHHGLGSHSYQIEIEFSDMVPKVIESEDNRVILDTLKEMNRQICHKHLPMVDKWLKVMSKAGQQQNEIKKIIDLKQKLVKAKTKFEELAIEPSKKHRNEASGSKTTRNVSEDSDNEFEDVPEKEGVECIPVNKRAEYGLDTLELSREDGQDLSERSRAISEEESFLRANGYTLQDAEDPTSLACALLESRRQYIMSQPCSSRVGASVAMVDKTPEVSISQVDGKKKKHLEVAPVVPFDMDLYYWEKADFEAPKIIRSENFNNNWASKDFEAEQVFEGDKGSLLRRTMAFTGKFEPVKWSCRAPLPNGKLCPRRDRVKCPFHGKIIPRDEQGKPTGDHTNQAGSSNTKTTATRNSSAAEEWREIQPEIEAATGFDLGGKGKGKGRKRNESDNKGLSKKQKYGRLTDLNKQTNTARSRLEGKVLSRKAVKRVTQEINSLATKRINDKFGDQFNYQLQ